METVKNSKVEKAKFVVPSRVEPFAGKNDKRPFTTCCYGTRTICMKPVAKVKEGEPGVAYPDFSDQVSIQAIVDSYKDSTGLEYALRQINNGRLMPSQLADKGTGGVDVSELPDNVNDAHRMALDSSEEAQKVAVGLGIDHLDPSKIEEIVEAAVNKKLAEAKAARAAQAAQVAQAAKKEGE